VNGYGIAVRDSGQDVTGNIIYYGKYNRRTAKGAINCWERFGGDAVIENNKIYGAGEFTAIGFNQQCEIRNLVIRNNISDNNGTGGFIASAKNKYQMTNVVIENCSGSSIQLCCPVKNVKIRNVVLDVGAKAWDLGIFIGDPTSSGVVIDGTTIRHHNVAGGDCIRFMNRKNRIQNCTFIKTTKTNLINDANKSNDSTIDYHFEPLQ
jgi:hypothetical protein